MFAAARSLGGGLIGAPLLAVCLAGLAFGAHGAETPKLQSALFIRSGDGHRINLPVTRFRDDDGHSFVLDRSGAAPLLKFDGIPEVWVLSASRGPRGDQIFVDDGGAERLCLTRSGGATVFTAQRPEGAAATTVGAAPMMRLPNFGPLALYQRLARASLRSSRAAGRLITYAAPGADPVSDGVLIDAVAITEVAVIQSVAASAGKASRSAVNKVVILRGPLPGVSLKSHVLTVTVVQALGFAGRPSSNVVLRAIGRR